MKRLFISQPMGGKTNNEILAARYIAIEEAERALGEQVEPIDSFFADAPADAKPLWYLGRALQLMSEADVIYFVPGWEDARGCRIEHQAAVQYDMCRIEKVGDITLIKGYA